MFQPPPQNLETLDVASRLAIGNDAEVGVLGSPPGDYNYWIHFEQTITDFTPSTGIFYFRSELHLDPPGDLSLAAENDKYITASSFNLHTVTNNPSDYEYLEALRVDATSWLMGSRVRQVQEWDGAEFHEHTRLTRTPHGYMAATSHHNDININQARAYMAAAQHVTDLWEARGISYAKETDKPIKRSA